MPEAASADVAGSRHRAFRRGGHQRRDLQGVGRAASGPRTAAGHIVVLDNLASHKVGGVVDAIEAVGVSVRDLPPYSPDLNPIDLAFSQFKKLLRDARGTDDGHAVEPVRPRAGSVQRNRVQQLPLPLRLP